jgi:hypothetical protein
LDRLTQVRAIVAAKYPQLSTTEQLELVDFVWKEAQRDSADRRELAARYPG